MNIMEHGTLYLAEISGPDRRYGTLCEPLSYVYYHTHRSQFRLVPEKFPVFSGGSAYFW